LISSPDDPPPSRAAHPAARLRRRQRPREDSARRPGPRDAHHAPIPARPDDPTPDPITRPLSEADARSEASRLARAAFAARKDIVDADGKPVSTPDFPPAAFVGGLEGGRWKLRIEPPAGSWARVSFGAFGEHEQVEVGFASE
jgi:hypothetical protein